MRAEDVFDVAAVDAWLRANAAPAHVASFGDDLPDVRQFPGGASNLTYQLTYAGPDGPRDLVLRRPPHGARGGSAHDMGREYRLQSALRPVFPLVPTMVAHCTDNDVLGAEFYVMERLTGTILRGELTPDLADAVTPADLDALCGRAVDVLVDLHEVDLEASGLASFGKGDAYVARQVAGWIRRYEAARTDDVPDYADVTAWLDAEQPADLPLRCLVHNDFRFDNLVLAGGPGTDEPFTVTGVLDWELATTGDPLMELGSALAYWVQDDDDDVFVATRRQPTNLPGMWTRQQVVTAYAGRRGLEVDAATWRFYEVFGLFRLAVILQQIWARYRAGLTSNPAFAGFGPMVGYLEQRCRRVIEAGPVGWDA